MQFFSKKGLVFFLTWVYDKCVNYIRQYLQGRVKFPIGGIVREPRSGRIWCDSKTDSIVWMEEDHDSTRQICLFLFCSFVYTKKGCVCGTLCFGYAYFFHGF